MKNAVPLLDRNRWYSRRRVLPTFVIVAAVLFVILFGAIPLEGSPPFLQERLQWAVTSLFWLMVESVYRAIVYAVGSRPGDNTAQVITSLTKGGMWWQFLIRWAVIILGAFAATIPIAKYWWHITPRRLTKIFISGASYFEGIDVLDHARTVLADDMAASGTGIALCPDIKLPRNRENQSFLIVGRPRYGKSTALRWLMSGILSRPNDKIVAFDSKGDVTSDWPGDDVVFLAPHDRRSFGWALGKDVLGEAGAREFAASLIVVSDREPNWMFGGQNILIALIMSVQKTYGTAWSWGELNDVMDLPDEEIRNLAERHYPPALRYLNLDPETNNFDRTSASYISTAMAPVTRVIRPLAMAWRNLAPEYQVSLREWILTENPERRTLILQSASHLPAISTAWISAAIETMARISIGPALPDSNERRIWYILDEWPTIPRIESIPFLLSKGPSKGICCVLACQNLEMVEETYGRNLAYSIIQNTDIQILFRLNAGPTSSYYCSTGIPHTKIKRTKKKAKTESDENDEKPDDICLVTPYDLATLKRTQDYVEGIVIMEGDIFRTRWPYSSWRAQRAPLLEAGWVTEQKPVETAAQTRTNAGEKN